MAENDIQNSNLRVDTIDTQVTTSNEQNGSAGTPRPSKSQDIQKIAKDTTQVVAKVLAHLRERHNRCCRKVSGYQEVTTLPRDKLASKS